MERIRLEKELNFDDFEKFSLEEWKTSLLSKDIDVVEDPEAGVGHSIFYTETNRETEPVDFEPKDCLLAQDLSYCKTPKAFNKAVVYGLSRGQTALHITLDLPSCQCIDPLDGRQDNAVGKEGLSFCDLKDCLRIFKDIDTKPPILFQSGLAGMLLLPLLLAFSEKKNFAKTHFFGTLGYDPFYVLLRTGRLPFNETGMLKLTRELLSGMHDLPNMQALRINGSSFGKWGSTAVDELAWAFASADYWLSKLDSDKAKTAEQLFFSFSSQPKVFLQIAKQRSARQLWTRLLKKHGIDQKPFSMHISTPAWNKSQKDPHTNILRTTLEALGAKLGGATSLTIAPFDEIGADPHRFSENIARNIDLILNQECGLKTLHDTAKGSFFLETLTKRLTDIAWGKVIDIDRDGGFLSFLENGIFQKQCENRFKSQLERLETQDLTLVGCNQFLNSEKKAFLSATSKTNVCELNRFEEIEKDMALSNKNERFLEKLFEKTTLDRNDLIQAFLKGASVEEVFQIINTEGSIDSPPLLEIPLAATYEHAH